MLKADLAKQGQVGLLEHQLVRWLSFAVHHWEAMSITFSGTTGGPPVCPYAWHW